MIDEPLSPDDELASAYLDADLTDVERARAEASPSVMATIDEYRRLRARLAAVQPASDKWRTSALRAAMSAFDESASQDVASAAPRAGVVDFSKRRQQQRWLVGSAAAAVLLVVGFALANRGGSDSKSISAAATTDLSRASKSEEAAPSAAIPRPTIGSIDGAGSVLLAIDTPQQLAALASEQPFERVDVRQCYVDDVDVVTDGCAVARRIVVAAEPGAVHHPMRGGSAAAAEGLRQRLSDARRHSRP